VALLLIDEVQRAGGWGDVVAGCVAPHGKYLAEVCAVDFAVEVDVGVGVVAGVGVVDYRPDRL
jgi:hypothetical protein